MRSSHTEMAVARVSPVASMTSVTVTACEARRKSSTAPALTRRSSWGVAEVISAMVLTSLCLHHIILEELNLDSK